MRGGRRRYPIDSPEGKRTSVLLLLAGLFVMLLGLPGTLEYHRMKDELVPVEAVIDQITGGTKRHTAYATYTYDGVTYEHVKLNYYNANQMEEGKPTTIHIHPEEPGQPVYNTLGAVFGFGAVFFLFSLLCCIAAFRPRKQVEKPPKTYPKSKKKKKKRKHPHRHR